MGEEQFDQLVKGLATREVSRRRALKLAAATAVGGALSLVGARGAPAAPGRCRRVGTPCRQHQECCDFFCSPTTNRCACRPPNSFACRRTKRCVECRAPGVFDPETCECICPEGTTPCDGSCCEEGSACCQSYYGGICCPPGVKCCPGGFCEQPPYYTCS